MPAASGQPDRIAAAGVAWACALLALAGPGAAPEPSSCSAPAEHTAEAGLTRAVSCGGGPPLRGPARRLFGLPIDPNTADARTLETLPGIGPARAAAITTERGRAPFASVGDLRRVRGIGPVTVARLEGLVAVAGQPMRDPGEIPDGNR